MLIDKALPDHPMKPLQTQGLGRVILLTIHCVAVLFVVGCGGNVQRPEKPKLDINTTQAPSPSLDQLESLINSRAYDRAVKVLSTLDFSTLSSQAQDRVTFLSARLALAQGKLSGCEQITAYAQTSSNDIRRKVANRLALSCLQPPEHCPSIKKIAQDQLKNLIEMSQSASLSKRIACGDFEDVGNALWMQRTKISEHPNAGTNIIEPIINALPGAMLKDLLPKFSDTPTISSAITTRLLDSFVSLLTEDEQRALVNQLPESHPTRGTWTIGKNGSRVVVCLPLSGSFAPTGGEIRTQLQQLSTMEPEIFDSRLHFIDCADESWQPELLKKAIDTHRATAVFSLTSTQVQSSLLTVINELNIVHFTLNPMISRKDVYQNTWTLHISAELTIGTAVTDALKALNRTTANPLPLRMAVVTDNPSKSPIISYLKPYKKSFAKLEYFSVPSTCSKELPVAACDQKTQTEWRQLVSNVQNVADGADAFELLYLDLSPMTLVTFLKYAEDQWVRENESSTGTKKSRPLLYADHRAMLSPNKNLIYDSKSNPPKVAALGNRFTRLAGRYSEEVRFLIHFDPLSSQALEFAERTTPLLSKEATQEVIALTEGLRLMDILLKESRASGIPILQLGKAVELGRTQTAGLTFSQTTRTLPRLRIARTKDGLFSVLPPP